MRGGRLSKLDVEDFSCAICLETLHKPAVNHCGHGEARSRTFGP